MLIDWPIIVVTFIGCVHLNYGYSIIKDTSVSMAILATIDVIMCLILTKKSLIGIITLQLSGDVLGRGLTTGPASNGLLSYYPEYISFGEFLAGMADHMCIKYFISSYSSFSLPPSLPPPSLSISLSLPPSLFSVSHR